MRRLPVGWVLFLAALLAALPAVAQLQALETENQRLIYPDPLLNYLAPYAARCFESSLRFEKKLFHYEPWEPVTITLMDLSDLGRANAGAIPRNNLNVNVAPVSFAYETLAPNERIQTIMNHEVVHIVSMDMAAGRDRTFRKLFGGKVLPTPAHPETIGYLYLTTPRIAVPSWYQEGTAVFFETWMAGGIGRAQGSWDEMVFRSMVRDATPFYDPLGLVSEGMKVDFQAAINAYLYGTRFISYLAYTRSPETVVEWLSRREGSEPYYAKQFEKVYGEPIENAWRAWTAWEQEFQQKNIDKIREFPISAYEDLSKRALGSVSRAFYDAERDVVYVGFNYPGVVAHVGAISLKDGSVDRIAEVKDPVLYTVTSLAWDPKSRTLFFTSDNTAYRDLRSVDPVTKKTKRLLKDARIGDLVVNPVDGAIWGIRQLNGLSTLVRVPKPYTEWNQVYTFEFGEVPYDLDLSPDGTLLSASVGQVSGNHSLRVMAVEALQRKDATPISETEFGTAIPSNFVFSPDGNFLFGSSYYTGVSNLFRYDWKAKKLDAVSNVETGMFRPVPLAGGDALIAFRFSGAGFVPVRVDARPIEDVSAITFLGQQIAGKHPVVTTWIPESPAEIPIETLITRQGKYPSVRGIRLESIYPVVEGYKDSWALGASAIFSDPIGMNRTTLTTSYSPASSLPHDERLHAALAYRRYDWRVDMKYNDADFYDLFGPTKVSRKGHSVGVGHKNTLIYDSPRELTLDADVTFYNNLERLPYAQNVTATFDELTTGTVDLAYSNIRSSIGAVDAEKGIRVELVAGGNYVHHDVIAFGIANLDLGTPLPLSNSSLWFRSSGGASSGDATDPFANFFFGGFGNNWVDHGAAKRYREFYAFPGVELNSIGGKTYAKAMLEWNLPPIRFRHAGTPGFYLTWARSSIFVTGIETDFNADALGRRVGAVGAQMDFRFATLSQLDLTLSLGYAVAVEPGQDRRSETMVSLKILR